MKQRYEFAGVVVEVTHQYGRIAKTCAPYQTTKTPDFHLEITKEDIEAEKSRGESTGFSLGYLEEMAFLSKFCDHAAGYGVIFFHAAAISVDGKAYLFAAPSGTGKTTHMRNLQNLLGDRLRIINGDKPFLRKINGEFHAFGSPWMGKENLGENLSAPIGGICFLERSETNQIRKMTSSEAFRLAYRQSQIPEQTADATPLIQSLAELINAVPLYQMGCEPSPDSAHCSYQGMMAGETALEEKEKPNEID